MTRKCRLFYWLRSESVTAIVGVNCSDSSDTCLQSSASQDRLCGCESNSDLTTLKIFENFFPVKKSLHCDILKNIL